MADHDQTIVLTCPAGSKEWSAVCPDYPEIYTTGYSSTEALRRYNAMLWRKHFEKQARLDKCHRLMRQEVRRAAGIPSWAINFPSWLLWKKKERNAQYDRMTGIVNRVCAAENLKDKTYEELTTLCVAEFNFKVDRMKGYKPLDDDVVEILSR